MNATVLIEQYIAAWNETDSEKRLNLIQQTWSTDARYVDPLMQGNGIEGIDQMIAAVQQKYPGFRFTLLGAVDAHQNHARFRWGMGPDGQEVVVEGTDFAVLSPGGLLQSVTGFLDRVPAQAAG
ncbi:nuclear transport factor 2 family protein [Deinococcus cellulosilyticus]|uniref:SnoaL-like domain-containing protein n=1 Tax=Deinococcus cellulosilyticus (strain DSM 18568 / NBRC 106333 / KACC 11606 / 5516J-15) TaxID=1223518 RepID=A0A511N1B0_DEIC1|nr:nuclear transport factor 2 family protein [Deinococcus cellulosilyticus]GEM46231.1 hypothetical protein DC3_18660 [Deinococcus cellulosilyticus NBRC 106333 = KACC 11606]